LLFLSTITITKPICEVLSLLFANNESIKTTSFSNSLSSLTNFKPLKQFSIYYYSRLLRVLASSFLRFTTCAAKKRLNNASS
jgi:hypothetical protein